MGECDSIVEKISVMKARATRNTYRLDIYEQVNNLVRFSAQSLVALQAYDMAQDEQDKAKYLSKIQGLQGEFDALKANLEKVYGEIRILTKPEGYILDQDHHTHLANQSIAFDWLFIAEKLFLEKVESTF